MDVTCSRLQGQWTVFMVFLLGVLLLAGCAGVKPNPSASKFEFTYQNQPYQIRSVFSDGNGESYNELVGENLLAVDFNQDRVIDRILKGEATLADAQTAYEFGLEKVGEENKLKEKQSSEKHFTYESSGFQYEISSFRPANASPFNEFKIIDKRQVLPSLSAIVVDQGADGTLDEVLKGDVLPGDMQSRYSEAVEAGLKKNAMVREDGAVLVKK